MLQPRPMALALGRHANRWSTGDVSGASAKKAKKKKSRGLGDPHALTNSQRAQHLGRIDAAIRQCMTRHVSDSSLDGRAPGGLLHTLPQDRCGLAGPFNSFDFTHNQSFDSPDRFVTTMVSYGSSLGSRGVRWEHEGNRRLRGRSASGVQLGGSRHAVSMHRAFAGAPSAGGTPC